MRVQIRAPLVSKTPEIKALSILVHLFKCNYDSVNFLHLNKWRMNLDYKRSIDLLIKAYGANADENNGWVGKGAFDA